MILVGDCLALVPAIRSASVDAIVTDPPYGLGFMGKNWDHGVPGEPFWREALRVAKPGAYLVAAGGTRTFHRLACAIEDAGWEMRDCLSWLYGSGFPKGRACLKPAWEPWLLARKPGRPTHLDVDACRIGHASADDLATSKAKNPGRSDLVSSAVYGEGRPQQRVNESGRWPPNVVLDEDAAALLDARSGEMTSRFFYCAKSSRAEREAGLSGGERKAKNWSSGNQNPGSFQAAGTDRTSTNHHPTVKPLDLMRWLCRLVTPPGGLILDPFAGSGTTGCAAALEGFRFLGMERETEYAEIARRRIAYWESLHQPTLDFSGVA